MSDTNYLAWPFFEDRHRTLARERVDMRCWAKRDGLGKHCGLFPVRGARLQPCPEAALKRHPTPNQSPANRGFCFATNA